MTRKLRVGLLFGGRSGEHEVSLASAASVLGALDSDKYEVVGIGITRTGQWLVAAHPETMLTQEVTPELPGTTPVTPDFATGGIVPIASGSADQEAPSGPLDIVFPLLHGPYGEDGAVQGFLEMAGIPYVGSGVLGSAAAMDKATMKNIFTVAGIPQVPYRLVRRSEWRRDPRRQIDNLTADLAFPLFVKPCNLGSSVGISKAHDEAELGDALDIAAGYDTRLIVEQGVDAREVECSVLGNEEPLVSLPGEVISHHEFYDYDAKYIDGLADLRIPADLTGEQIAQIQDLARRAFLAVDASGLARVDFFVRHDDDAVLVNEINTMPGLTPHSMYHKLWEAAGLSFPELVDRLIEYGIQRHGERSRLRVDR